MADPQPPNMGNIMQALVGGNAANQVAAAQNFARYVQELNQPPAPAVPERITLHDAINRNRPDGAAAVQMKLTKMMPDIWGSVKDGDPESHCVHFENFCNMHQYNDDDTKIAWFQATLPMMP